MTMIPIEVSSQIDLTASPSMVQTQTKYLRFQRLTQTRAGHLYSTPPDSLGKSNRLNPTG